MSLVARRRTSPPVAMLLNWPPAMTLTFTPVTSSWLAAATRSVTVTSPADDVRVTEDDVADTVPALAVSPPTAPFSSREPLADIVMLPPLAVRISPPESRTGFPPKTGASGGTFSTAPLALTYFPAALIR